jgi:hypothetical protein
VVRPGAALVVGALIVVMLACVAVIQSAAHQTKLSGLGLVALYLSFGLVGVVVAWHQPRNSIGWVLLGVTFFFLLDGLGSGYAYLDYRLHGGRLPFGWLAVLLAPSWAPAIVLAGLALMLFPDGRILARWWKPMLWAYLGLGALWLGGAFAISLSAVIGHHVSIDSSGGLSSLDNPAGSTAWWGGVQGAFFPAVAVCWLVRLAGQVLSYRRSSGERRLQLKWLLSGATVFIAAGIAVVTRSVVAELPEPTAFRVGQSAATVHPATSRRAHMDHHRAAIPIPGILDRQRSAVAQPVPAPSLSPSRPRRSASPGPVAQPVPRAVARLTPPPPSSPSALFLSVVMRVLSDCLMGTQENSGTHAARVIRAAEGETT